MIIEELERELPPATLLLGPAWKEMYQAAYMAAQRHGALIADFFGAFHLSAVDARALVRFAQVAPFGPFKVAIIVLDGASAQAQNILLKVLEEPPPTVRFILVASARPLQTIMSRCQVTTVPGEDVQPEPDGKVTAQVAAAVTAAMSGRLDALDAALAGWGDAHNSALYSLLAEAAAGRDPNRMLDRVQARRLLGALSRFSGAHPRLAAHAAFITVLSDKEKHV